VQLVAGDYISQDVSVGFTGLLPAELQGFGAQCSEDQGARGTGSAQSERRAFTMKDETRELNEKRDTGDLKTCKNIVSRGLSQIKPRDQYLAWG